MTGLAGNLQSSCTAGEINDLLWFRHDLKFARKANKSGLAYARNIEPVPQGGFRLTPGTELVEEVNPGANRLHPFKNSQGQSYDVVFSDKLFQVYDQTAKVDERPHVLTAAQILEISIFQHQDTLLMFHEDVETPRIKQENSGWSADKLPYTNIPRHDYGSFADGSAYTGTNAGTAAVWEIEFFNVGAGTIAVPDTRFTLQLSGEKTRAIAVSDLANPGSIDEVDTALNISAALADLATLAAGYAVAAHATEANTIVITFSGADNLGDKWSVVGEIVNNPDAAIVAVETTVGETPGEDIISATRGWPATGTFYQQSLVAGGFKSLSNNWMKSVTGDPFNFNTKQEDAAGAFVIPMDIEGGEKIVQIRSSRNLVILTDEAEYWLSERKLSKSEAPVHVEADRNGARPGGSVAKNEGAIVFVHESGDVISEFRFTDVDGNFTSQPISVLATHLVRDVIAVAQRKAQGNRDGNRIGYVQADGQMRIITILRSQEVTAFARYETDGSFRFAGVNGRNEMSMLVERQKSVTTVVNLERLIEGQLLHGAVDIVNNPPAKIVAGLAAHEGAVVWAIADDDVLGPFIVTNNQISLPVDVAAVTVGRWTAPLMRTLPLSREVSPGIVRQRKGRVSTVKVRVVDTTSIAISANGSKPYDVDLLNYGAVKDAPELTQGYSGWVEMSGFSDVKDDLQIEITQIRPGRLTVAAWVIEAQE